MMHTALYLYMIIDLSNLTNHKITYYVYINVCTKNRINFCSSFPVISLNLSSVHT